MYRSQRVGNILLLAHLAALLPTACGSSARPDGGSPATRDASPDARAAIDAATPRDAAEGADATIAADASLVDATPDASAIEDAARVGDDAAPDEDASVVDAGEVDGGGSSRPYVDLIVQLRDFGAYEGKVVELRAQDRSIDEVHGPVRGTIASGSLDLVIENGFVRDLFGESGYLWIDVSADGTCADADDLAADFFINRDGETGPLVMELRPDDLSLSTCAHVLAAELPGD
jgi:hypothetical protein